MGRSLREIWYDFIARRNLGRHAVRSRQWPDFFRNRRSLSALPPTTSTINISGRQSRKTTQISIATRSSVAMGNQIPIVMLHTKHATQVPQIGQIHRHRQGDVKWMPASPCLRGNFSGGRSDFTDESGVLPFGVLTVIPNLARHPFLRFLPGLGA